ncbi:MAG TPA: holo-ACP synthase [Gemmatimonadaceae bacterium]|nr:holo-ACP synthase [Gemmatimonadaceae bacterium]
MILGVGMDVIEIARVRRLIERHGEHALRRLFTDAERAYAETHRDPARHFAARIAAKEAAFKALATHAAGRGIGWRDMEVIAGGGRPPRLLFHGQAAECAAELEVSAAWLTITHAVDIAAAAVILER